MAIDKTTVSKIARLARIEVPEEQKDTLAQELSGIFTWIEQLGEVNTENVEPLASVSDTKLPWRKDEVTDGHIQKDILANAPASEHGCFVVPKVIDQG